jgi:hypothetical protein
VKTETKFLQETFNVNYLENHPLFFFPKLYNDLNKEIKLIVKDKAFTKKVKDFFLDGLV